MSCEEADRCSAIGAANGRDRTSRCGIPYCMALCDNGATSWGVGGVGGFLANGRVVLLGEVESLGFVTIDAAR